MKISKALSRWRLQGQRLNRAAFCLLLLPSMLAQWGCGDGIAGPKSGSASSSNVGSPAKGVPTQGRVLVAGVFSKAHSPNLANETTAPEATSPSRGEIESTSPAPPAQQEAQQTQGLDACIKSAGATGAQISELICNGQGVETLDGIEGLHALTRLELNNNDIFDLRPLAQLTKLQSLKLASNRIQDISPLAALTKLTDLILEGNRIDDVAPLAGLNRLMVLQLNSNQISDVDDLGAIERLEYLNLSNNEINDVSSLGRLTGLEYLHLSANSVTLGVRNLDGLKEAISIVMVGNNNIACSDLDALEDALAKDVVFRPSACAPY